MSETFVSRVGRFTITRFAGPERTDGQSRIRYEVLVNLGANASWVADVDGIELRSLVAELSEVVDDAIVGDEVPPRGMCEGGCGEPAMYCIRGSYCVGEDH